MTFTSLLWTLTIGWFLSCMFYLWKIFSVSRASGHSIVSLLGKGTRASNTFVRRLFINIIIATVLFLVILVIAFLIAFSS